MAKTDHQCTRDLHTKGKPSKPRSLGEQSVAHHVTDLPTMGLDEAQALGTMDSSMGIAADVRWSPGAGSRTSLVAALALFGTLGDKTDTSDRGRHRHLQMLRPDCQTSRLHDGESCWHSQENTHSVRQHHESVADT